MDVQVKYPFSISTPFNALWNLLMDTALQSEFSPLTKLAKAAVLSSVLKFIMLVGSYLIFQFDAKNHYWSAHNFML